MIPIFQRKRIRTYWDIKPAGFESITALQAKHSGIFQMQNIQRHAAFPGQSSFSNLPPSVEEFTGPRSSRRVVVSNIKEHHSEQLLKDTFNNKLKENDEVYKIPGNSVVKIQFQRDKNYALIEFRNNEEANLAAKLDGILLSNNLLKIRKPKDYLEDLKNSQSSVSGNVPDSDEKIFIGSLPTFLNEDQVMELLKSFGELRSFNLVKDSATSISKVCIYSY